jgi:hypothetical protein
LKQAFYGEEYEFVSTGRQDVLSLEADAISMEAEFESYCGDSSSDDE